jgi:hypothetical protein
MKPQSNNTDNQKMMYAPPAVKVGMVVTTGTGTNSAIPTRNHLSTRRSAEIHEREYEGQPFRFTLGRDHNGAPAEIFITAIAKSGSALQQHVEVQAILASLLLQYGVPLSVITHSISGPLKIGLDLFLENSCSSAGAHSEQGQGHHAHHGNGMK